MAAPFLSVFSVFLGFPVHEKGQRPVFLADLFFQDAAFPVLTDEARIPRLFAADGGKIGCNVSTVSFTRCQPYFCPLYKR